MYYHGADGERNAVGIVPRDYLSGNVLEVKRVSDRVIAAKLDIGQTPLNVLRAYAPQTGYAMEGEVLAQYG